MKKVIILVLTFVLSFSSVCFAAETATPAEEETTETTTEYAIQEILEPSEEETTKETDENEIQEISESLEEETTQNSTDVSEGFSLPDAIDSINESGFDVRKIFNLIGDLVDIASNDGASTTAGNIIRAVGNLVCAIINNDDNSVIDANGDLAKELILDENSLSQLSSGMILDIYDATKEELIKRGINVQ